MIDRKISELTELESPGVNDLLPIVDILVDGLETKSMTVDNLITRAFGSCYGMEIAWEQANAVQNTWYDILDTDMIDGELNDVAHNGSGLLTVSKAGFYEADWAGAFEADAANVHVQVTFSINGTEVDPGMNHFETVGANREAPCTGNAILSLAAGDTVNVSIRTTDVGTPDLHCDHLMIRLIQIGGP